MREMHKWKDKVEFSLDNRQIFFLFFGLSVVGCFVFALGVMVGRRVEFDGGAEAAALADDSLALLEAVDEEEPLSFKDGLAEPATEGVPATRDPDAPVTDATPAPKLGSPSGETKSSTPAKSANKPGSEPVMAKATQATSSVVDKSGKFTLQMKAFSNAGDAESFAATLRERGHQVRVEPHEVKGRLWHRVRVGAFDSWTEGLAAKDEFEKTESVIAYVVRM